MTWLPHAIERSMLTDLARSVLPAWSRCSGGPRGPVVSFNLSGQQFVDADFMAAVHELEGDAAAGLAIEVHHLQFFTDRANELAPEVAWVPTPQLDQQLADLRAGGFEVWLDDFGDRVLLEEPTDHAHVDVVKLDRSLLTFDIPGSRGSSSACTSGASAP